jgi:hypothetical protein
VVVTFGLANLPAPTGSVLPLENVNYVKCLFPSKRIYGDGAAGPKPNDRDTFFDNHFFQFIEEYE